MEFFKNADGKSVLLNMVKAIRENKDYLGQVDGLIGDGDHGVNMNKGFSLFQKRYQNADFSFTEGLFNLGEILLNEIGGSMGPIYGTIFMTMAEQGRDSENIGVSELSKMFSEARNELFYIVEARPGDKTLVDSFSPAVDAMMKAKEENVELAEALTSVCNASTEGKASTQNLIARYGRAACLGERSKGVWDAGAVSCDRLLNAMADGIRELLQEK